MISIVILLLLILVIVVIIVTAITMSGSLLDMILPKKELHSSRRVSFSLCLSEHVQLHTWYTRTQKLKQVQQSVLVYVSLCICTHSHRYVCKLRN